MNATPVLAGNFQPLNPSLPRTFLPGRAALQTVLRRCLPLIALLLAGINPLLAQFGPPVTLAPMQRLF